MQTHQDRHLKTTREVAESLRVCVSTVRRWTREDRIPAIVIDRRIVRYNLEAVLAALQQRPPDTDKKPEPSPLAPNSEVRP